MSALVWSFSHTACVLHSLQFSLARHSFILCHVLVWSHQARGQYTHHTLFRSAENMRSISLYAAIATSLAGTALATSKLTAADFLTQIADVSQCGVCQTCVCVELTMLISCRRRNASPSPPPPRFQSVHPPTLAARVQTRHTKKVSRHVSSRNVQATQAVSDDYLDSLFILASTNIVPRLEIQTKVAQLCSENGTPFAAASLSASAYGKSAPSSAASSAPSSTSSASSYSSDTSSSSSSSSTKIISSETPKTNNTSAATAAAVTPVSTPTTTIPPPAETSPAAPQSTFESVQKTEDEEDDNSCDEGALEPDTEPYASSTTPAGSQTADPVMSTSPGPYAWPQNSSTLSTSCLSTGAVPVPDAGPSAGPVSDNASPSEMPAPEASNTADANAGTSTETPIPSAYATPTDPYASDIQSPTTAATTGLAVYDGGVSGLGLTVRSYCLGSGLLAMAVAFVF